MENKSKIENKSKLVLKDFLLSFLIPTLIGKAFVLYFGLNYTNYPGEGYGYGLIVALSFTIFMIGKFLWKYRNYDDT
jgi:hypothetical protein